MTTQAADHFALSVLSLAFALKKLVESDYYDESKHKLVQEFARLKNKVQLHTKILEQKQTAEKFQQQQKMCA
jgi:histidinol-phosphate/aromatic aminotransferase/cobyric acid decarboxylase-like protein